MKMKKERFNSAERILKSLKQKLLGNPQSAAFQAWCDVLEDAQAQVKTKLTSVRMMVFWFDKLQQQDVRAVVCTLVANFREDLQQQYVNQKAMGIGVGLMAKIAKRLEQAETKRCTAEWRAACMRDSTVQSRKNSGLRSIAAIMKKWSQQQMGVSVATWQRAIQEENMHDERFAGGIRSMRQICDKWRKQLFKSIIMGWVAKRKITMGKEKLAKKKAGALAMMEKGSKEVEKNMLLMMAETNKKADHRVEQLKTRYEKDAQTLKLEIHKLREDNERLKLQLGDTDGSAFSEYSDM
eukprot:TRINITY_DN8103_c0_g1_i1.p1 TRINITY_DN8103_c0_g1~~TRINITY_DN8103_c0_g1_i1.p1  ORF type:complete len:295 (+),score=99.96 TRINITY_DN8103_c0_g1_i1:844-1728(+)